MTTPVGASTNPPVERRKTLAERVPDGLYEVMLLFAVLVVVGIAAIVMKTSSLPQFATALEWMLASLLSGGAVGFLFGIPKILQSDVAPQDAATPDAKPVSPRNYRQEVNSNLTEISDWLTKIIVGLGLINLDRAPGKLRHVASVVATGMDGRPNGGSEAFVIALIVASSTLGFLFSYIATRLFLAGEFSKADQAWAVKAQSVLSQQRVEIASNQSAIASLTSATEVMKQALYPAADQSSSAAPPSGATAITRERPALGVEDPGIDVGAELLREANEYLNIQVNDYSERVRLKDAAANRMADLVLKSPYTRDQLVDLIKKEHNEGLVAALATVSNLRPAPGDFARLIGAGHGIDRLHVRYRVLVAIGELIRKRLVDERDFDQLRALLDEYEIGADSSLAALIRSTRLTIDKRPVPAP